MKSYLFHSVFSSVFLSLLTTCLSDPFHKGDGKAHPIHVHHNGKIHHIIGESMLDKDSLEGVNHELVDDHIILFDAQARSEKLSAASDPDVVSEKLVSESVKPTTTKIIQKTNAKTTDKVVKKEKQTQVATTTPSVDKDPAAQISQEPLGSSVPTTLPSTTKPTTTQAPVPKPTQPTELSEDLYCLCDIHSYVCDMNCCCDADCTAQDRKFFTHCLDQVGIRDERSSPRRQRSCYKSFVTFKHYTTESGVLNDNKMLCILRDNSKADNVLPTSTVNEIRDRINNGEISILPKYSINSNNRVQYKQEPYKFGSPIVGVKILDLEKDKVDLIPYGLPVSYHSIPCTKITEPVKFLEYFYSRCQLLVSNFTHDCNTLHILDANSFINQIQVLANPGNEDSDRDFLLITPRKVCNGELCSNESDQSDRNEFPKPTYNQGKQLCQNVLTELNITFYFGSEGITDIFASAQLQDLQISTRKLTQEFRSNFLWNTELNNTDANSTSVVTSWPRSGNPGYIVGKPIIMGEKVIIQKENAKGNEKITSTTEASLEETKEVEMVKVSKDPSNWMSIHSQGKCPDNPDRSPRKSVLFDYSHMTICSLNLTEFKYCEDLQLIVAKILLGMDDPVTFEKLKWQVAAFGNSNPAIPSQWVPVTTKNFPLGIISTPGNSKRLISKGCDSIVASLHITITYAFVGTVDFPQAKITGVLYEPGESVLVQSKDVSKRFYISTTVTFRDVTASPFMRIAKPPVLSITLPKDFFYPFSR